MSRGGKQKKEDQYVTGNKVDSERKVTMFPLERGNRGSSNSKRGLWGVGSREWLGAGREEQG